MCQIIWFNRLYSAFKWMFELLGTNCSGCSSCLRPLEGAPLVYSPCRLQKVVFSLVFVDFLEILYDWLGLFYFSLFTEADEKVSESGKISVFVEETGLLLFLHSDSSSLAGHVSPRPIRGGGDARQLYKSSVEAPREAGMKNNRKLHTDHSSKDSFNLLIFFYT